MKTKITQEDIDIANQAMRDGKGVTHSCPVFQALKRLGVPVEACAYTVYYDPEFHLKYLHHSCARVTRLEPKNWQSALGVEVDLPDASK